MAELSLKHIDKIYDNNVQAVLISIWKSKIKNLLYLLVHLDVENQQHFV